MSPDVYHSGPPRPTRPNAAAQLLHRIGQAAPYGIIVYVIALATLRIGFSPYLEVDEAEMVGFVDLRLIYPNGHPPLFHWLTRAALEATEWDWAMSLAILRYGALGLFHLAVWDTARRLAGHRAALLAVAASALLPQIAWMSVATLAHTTLAMALAAATLNVMIRAFEDATPRNYVIFGLVAGLGVLTSFAFPIFLIAFVAATALEPELRYAFTRKALFAVGAFAALALPLLVGAIVQFEDAAGGADALYGDPGWVGAIDPPFLGVDGLVALIGAAIAWAGLAALVWLGARAFDRTYGPPPGPAHPFAPVIGRAMLYGLAGCAALALVTDVRTIEVRHLTPLLAAFPAYLAVAWPLRRSAYAVAGVGAFAMVAAPVAFWLTVRYGEHRYAIPYPRIAAQIAREVGGEPTPIVAERHDDAANMVLALDWPGATTPTRAPLEDRVILLWRGGGDPPTSLAPEGFAPERGIKTFRAPLENESGEEMLFTFQLYERLAPGARLLTAEDDRVEDAPVERAAPEVRPLLGPTMIEAGNLLPYPPAQGGGE